MLAFAGSAEAGDTAEDLFRRGLRAQRQGRHIEAYVLYHRARALDPANAKFMRAARVVRRGAAQLLAAAGEHRTAIEMAPDSWEFETLASERDAAKPPAAVTVGEYPLVPRPPATLTYANRKASFRFRGTIREAYDEVAAEFGVDFIFDDDFPVDREIRADLTDCDFRCAMRALGDLGPAFAVPLGRNVALIAADDSATRAELDAVAVAAIPLDPALAADEVAAVGQAIQEVLDIKRFQAAANGGWLFLRDSATKIDMARALAANLLHPRAEAVIDVLMIMASDGRQVRAGVDLPDALPVTTLGSLFEAMPGGAGAQRLVRLGGGLTAVGVTVGDAAALAQLERSDASTLHAAQVRAAHGMPAVLKVGERFPIATAQYSSGPSGGGGQGSAGFVQPPPSITFEDLGLNLEVTPHIHSALEVTLELAVNFRLLAGGAVNDVPVLSNSEFQSRVRLRRGQFGIVTGTSVYERRVNRSGPWGLHAVPWLGALFQTHRWQWVRSELLVLLRPRVVRLPAGELAGAPEFLFGPEMRPVPQL